MSFYGQRLCKPTIGALLLGIGCLVAVSSQAQLFPHAIDYAGQLQSSIQYNNNPGRLNDALNPKKSSPIFVNTAGLAARIPLLSQDTRLEIVGVSGMARYRKTPQLNHHPRRFDANLYWRAGQLLEGSLGYFYQHKRYESDWQWPASDTTSTKRWSGKLGLKPSDALTLPLLRLYDERVQYYLTDNQNLFRKRERGGDVSVHYQSVTGSSIALGWQHSRTRYPLRYRLNRTDLDTRYSDSEPYAELFWNYSVKTAFYIRVGWMQRKYQQLSQRNTRLLTLNSQLIWNYSPKTAIRLRVWNLPFNNDEDPAIIYTATKGTALSLSWKPTPKISVSILGSYERLRDNTLSGAQVQSTRVRIGPRLAWQASRNLNFYLDYHYNRKVGDFPGNSYRQNIVRLGMVLYTDGKNSSLNQLFSPVECRWMYLETELCR